MESPDGFNKDLVFILSIFSRIGVQLGPSQKELRVHRAVMPSEYGGHFLKKNTKSLGWEKGYRLVLVLSTAFPGMGDYTEGRK